MAMRFFGSGGRSEATVQNDPERVREVLGGGNGVVKCQIIAVDTRGSLTSNSGLMIGIWACDK